MKSRSSSWVGRRRSAVVLAVAALAVCAPAEASAASAPPLEPIDRQNWVFPQDQTWADYESVPGTDWANPALVPSIQKWKTALVVVDFPDQPFVVTLPTGSTIFGNPQPGVPVVPREDVPEFYRDFLNTPSMLNNFVTMNKYWMENSLGRYGVQVDAFGPYRMQGNQYEYFLNDAGGAGSACPTGTVSQCRRMIRQEAQAAWIAGTGNPLIALEYDNIFYMNAGQDESGTWQEFGEMRFQTKEDVTEPFGNPDPTKPNWAPTRYIPWTSFKAAQSNWPNASGNTSVEAESSGMGVYAHELSHNLGIGDNYNNPYGVPPRRAYTGPWDMLSRGSFNGPGGPHKRWFIPPTEGGSLGSNHNLRNRMKLGFVKEENVLRLDRDALAASGAVVAKVTARAVDPGPTGLTGINVILTGGDKAPACSTSTDPLCDGRGYNNYTAEVVQRIGNDSFTTGHGVLLTKTKNADSAPFGWIIDAHPEDIDTVDFYRPDGTPSMISIGDYRQLSDATFNAGLNSGTQFEYVDAANSLHFYVVDVERAANGVLSYRTGVRSTAGAGPHTRGVAVADAPAEAVSGLWTYCDFPLTNTGTAAAVSPTIHPEDVAAYVNKDIYRLSASAAGAGWSAQLANALAAPQFGQTVTVPVYVTRTESSSATAQITLRATSESDGTKTDIGTCAVSLQPTAVTLRSFSARRAGPATVLFSWRTGAEVGLLGFDVYRGRSRLTKAPVRARNAVGGARYTYRARVGSRAGATYRLRATRRDGSRVWLGSASVR
ncbi:MAG: M6 family metalloprotease domain-containing protein [Gaiellaceae bacterium]